jgi:BirA family biotin operon repressor/biotin-[acetyl-CoA-carboxylase] ligase
MKPIGHLLQVLPTIDSTNNYAMGLIQQGLAAHGTAIFALEQSAGKGQRGKEWKSTPGENIMISIIYENIPLSIDQQFLFAASIALGTYDFFNSFAGEPTFIKWPNDILWRDRKSVGILIENKISADTQKWNWSVVGIGININQTQFPPTSTKAVSLKQITGKNWDVIELSGILCQHLQNRWQWMQKSSAETIMTAYNAELFKRGQMAKFLHQGKFIESLVVQVNADGLLETENNGQIQQFQVGEITWQYD